MSAIAANKAELVFEFQSGMEYVLNSNLSPHRRNAITYRAAELFALERPVHDWLTRLIRRKRAAT